MSLLGLLLGSLALAGEVVVDVLDVGQGDAVLIRGGGKAVLIDAGPKEGEVVAKLEALGVRRLDLVIASHPHADHIGRMLEVVTTFEVGLFLDNGLPHTTKTYMDLMTAVEENRIRYRPAEEGLKLNLGDEATFTVLFPRDHPLVGTRSDLNSNSVVVRLDHGDVDFLFTGDAEAPTEQALVFAGLEPVDVLKVAHHGSGHSTTEAFLGAAEPRFALISCGTDNKYGHPDPEALERLARAGAEVYRTDLSGNLRVVSDGRDVSIWAGDLDRPALVRANRATAPTHAVVEPTIAPPAVAAPVTSPPVDLSGVATAAPLPSPRSPRDQRRAERDAARAAKEQTR